jgi:hypothetical protein
VQPLAREPAAPEGEDEVRALLAELSDLGVHLPSEARSPPRGRPAAEAGAPSPYSLAFA